MKTYRTPIIPSKPVFNGNKNTPDLEAICVFVATGFFLDNDTYFKECKTLPIGSNIKVSDTGILVKPYFTWHHTPETASFAEIVDQFTQIFETIIKEQTSGKQVILPLSGGLDSRTQAAALKHIQANVNAYSYEFNNGLPETRYARQIAEAEKFPFSTFTVTPGYLWNCIDDLALINGCYSEFTHPRQMAFIHEYASMGNLFSLGHWGDVLFDDMGVDETLSIEKQTDIILKKIVKKGGMELAEALWKSWGLEGNFTSYLKSRVRTLVETIDIPHSANARIRAFKSLYWAPRWTSVNLSVFESVHPISLPYYDNRMCEFICTVPEQYLSGRNIQIEYLKRRAPELARITWQDHRPFNLYNYNFNKAPYNLPYRITDKLKRTLSPKKYILRNWELQFLGEQNDLKLKERLFEEQKFSEWIPKELVSDFYQKFKTHDAVYYSHPVSMLLTLSLFSKHFKSI